MKREDLYYVLFEQQKQMKKSIDLVSREKTEDILPFLKSKLPIIISGLRRAGKSTLMQIIKENLRLKEKNWLYVNFNDERFIGFSVKDFQKILDFIEEEGFRKNCYLFLDEVQEAKSWEKWVDRIKEEHPIFITGSNSNLLSKEISTVLTGRSISTSLYPFSFREFLNAKKIEIKNWNLDLKKQSKIRKAFLDYTKIGGIPKPVIENNPRLLAENYENIIYRDIVKRFNQNLERSVKEISVFLLSNISKEVSLRNLSKTINIKNLSTVKSILDSFEKSFLFFFVHKFDYSVKKQIQNPRKVYSIDTGFVNEVGFRFSENKGRILENIVFIELKRKGREIFYYSEKKECDFVIREKTKINKAIQVCYELNDENRDREINGLLDAMNKFKLKQGLILTMDEEDELLIDKKKIIIKPVWKWLLGK
jgi:predicted AAA+ superfamily ATPase